VTGNPHFGVQGKRVARTWSAATAGAVAVAVGLAASTLWPSAGALLAAPDGVARLSALNLRIGTLLVAVAALRVYAALVRSDDRELLALLPVDSARVSLAALAGVALAGAWIPLAALVGLGPIVVDEPGRAGALVAFLFGTWALGVVASGIAFLAAVGLAEHPRWAPLLDLVRGSNLRTQAAFVYAPGVVLAATGLLIAASGDAAARGEFWGVLPMAAALGILPAVPPLARRGWFRATIQLADVDGRHTALEGVEDARRVAWEGMLRWLPASWRPWALRDLRHGWRARRTWVNGAWLLGLVALALGWQAAPDGPRIAAAASATAALLLAAVVVPLAADEPPFLRSWLPPGGLAASGARALVVFAWIQPAVGLPAAGTLLRSGSAAAMVVVRGEMGAAAGVLLGLVAARWRERGLRVYAPVAVLLAAAAWTR
jgi:hypothetical protein